MGETERNDGGRGNFCLDVLYEGRIKKKKNFMRYLNVLMYSLNEAVEDDINRINL